LLTWRAEIMEMSISAIESLVFREEK
jgi:hypothetical protein